MKKIKCKVRLHGSFREFLHEFESISAAKKWIKEYWEKPYTIIKLKIKN